MRVAGLHTPDVQKFFPRYSVVSGLWGDQVVRMYVGIVHEFVQYNFSSTSIKLLTNLPFLKKTLSMEITHTSLFTHASQE